MNRTADDVAQCIANSSYNKTIVYSLPQGQTAEDMNTMRSSVVQSRCSPPSLDVIGLNERNRMNECRGQSSVLLAMALCLRQITKCPIYIMSHKTTHASHIKCGVCVIVRLVKWHAWFGFSNEVLTLTARKAHRKTHVMNKIRCKNWKLLNDVMIWVDSVEVESNSMK